MPPELAQEPIEITQRGSTICSYSRCTTGAIFMKQVPATIMTSAWRGEARITSEPKRESVVHPGERGRELHITAGEAEVERPERVFPAPVDEIVELGQDDILSNRLLDDVVLVVVDAGW